MAQARRITERGMVRRAAPLVLAALSLCPREYRVMHELPIGPTIADMVFLRSASERRWPAAPLTVAESVVLSVLRQRGTARMDTIGRDVFMPAQDVRHLLEGRLAHWRLVRPMDRGLVQARASWVTSSEIIAVEAKLARWREALEQATAYRQYADRVFVLLPRGSAAIAAEHADRFRAVGVGLLAYDSDGVERLIACQRARVHTWHREYALSRA